MKAFLKRVLPWQAIAIVRMLRPHTRREAEGLAPLPSYVRLLRVYENAEETRPRRRPVRLTIIPLDRARIALRPGTTDARVLFATLHNQFHLPPPDIDPRVILDLGANVGLTMAHFLSLYPNSRVTGLEPDPSTAAIARRNVSHWGDRAEIIEAAVWSSDTRLGFASEPGAEWGGHVVDEPQAPLTVQAVSLNTFLSDVEAIDYLKMDIEGAEEEVLTRNTAWASKVGCLKVEVHAPCTVERCRNALEDLGFMTEEFRDFAVVGRRY